MPRCRFDLRGRTCAYGQMGQAIHWIVEKVATRRNPEARSVFRGVKLTYLAASRILS